MQEPESFGGLEGVQSSKSLFGTLLQGVVIFPQMRIPMGMADELVLVAVSLLY